MKKLKTTLSALALAAGAMLASAPASAAIELTFTPASSHINVGDSVTIDVSISGLGSEILSAFDLNFLYSSSVLNYSFITYYGNLGNELGLGNNGLPEGDLGFDNSSLESDADLMAMQLDDFLLFSFEMVGFGDGVTSFSLGANPDFERNFVGLNAESLSVNVGSACVAVGQGSCDNRVPEPASFGLAGLALLAAGAAGRMRRRSRAAV